MENIEAFIKDLMVLVEDNVEPPKNVHPDCLVISMGELRGIIEDLILKYKDPQP